MYRKDSILKTIVDVYCTPEKKHTELNNTKQISIGNVTVLHAFANTCFNGNPAGIIMVDQHINPVNMFNLAIEMDLPIIVTLQAITPDSYHIRWFTKNTELQLCGHGTMAASYYLFDKYVDISSNIKYSTESGRLLSAELTGGFVSLSLPSIESVQPELTTIEAVKNLFDFELIDVRQAENDLIAVLKNEQDIVNFIPDFDLIAALQSRTLILTAKTTLNGEFRKYDIISRVFAPNISINEDQVCISAHCKLQPYWYKRRHLSKEIHALQWSKNGGSFVLDQKEDNVIVKGTCRYTHGLSKERHRIAAVSVPTYSSKKCGLKATMIESCNESIPDKIPTSLAYFEVGISGSTEAHEHLVSEIWCITEGCGVVESDGHLKNVKQGDFVYLKPGCSHQLRNTGSSCIKGISLWWLPEEDDE